MSKGKVAIVAGTGIYDIPGVELKEQIVETPYGQALVHLGQGENDHLVFLTRHGPEHTTPPHMVKYRANIKALQQLGVNRVLAAYAVGSINKEIPPLGLALLNDFIDFTNGRPLSFFDGGDSGLAHTDMSAPYCPILNKRLSALAPQFDIDLFENATYVCFNGPRFETPAEIRMSAMLGGDVVGMTGATEVILANELNLHFAAIALSINWAVGIEPTLTIVSREEREGVRRKLLDLFLAVANEEWEGGSRRETAVSH
ncbi:MAG: MTAP family purine nucleoside phosphorylase [Chloroflexota bacterium]